VQIIEFLVVLSSAVPCYLVPLRQHPILEYPQPMSLPHRDRPSLIPIKKTIVITTVMSFFPLLPRACCFNYFFNIPTNAHNIHVKIHIKTLNTCPYMFRSLFKTILRGLVDCNLSSYQTHTHTDGMKWHTATNLTIL